MGVYHKCFDCGTIVFAWGGEYDNEEDVCVCPSCKSTNTSIFKPTEEEIELAKEWYDFNKTSK